MILQVNMYVTMVGLVRCAITKRYTSFFFPLVYDLIQVDNNPPPISRPQTAVDDHTKEKAEKTPHEAQQHGTSKTVLPQTGTTKNGLK